MQDAQKHPQSEGIMVRTLPRKRPLDSSFTLRFTKEQRVTVEAAARTLDMPVGVYVREVVTADAKERLAQHLEGQ